MNENPPMLDRRRNALSALTGEFTNAGQEAGFRAGIWPVWYGRARTVILAGLAAHLITTVNDYVLLGLTGPFYLLVLVRLVVTAQGFALLWIAARNRTARVWDSGLLIFLLLLISAFLCMTWFRPDGLRLTAPAAILVLCIVYMVPMTRLWVSVASSAYLSLGMLLVGALGEQASTQHLFVSSIQLLTANLIGYLVCRGLHRDVRIAWTNQQSLERRERHQRMLAHLTSQFLGVHGEQINTLVRQVFQALCEYSGSDRAYLMEFDAGHETGSMTHEWCAEGITPAQDTMQNIPSGRMPWASLKLQRGEIVQVDRVSDLPPEASAERELNLARGVQSFLCVPLSHDGLLLGMIGLDRVRRQQDWHAETVDLLRFVGQTAFSALLRSRAEHSLRASESQYQTLAGLSPVGIFRTDSDGYCLYFNERWKTLTGLPMDMALGNRWRQAVHPEDIERVSATWSTAVSQATGAESEYRYQRPDGSVVWVHARVRPHVDDNGKLLGFVGTVDDITERKRSQLALEQRARLDECLNTLTVRFLLHDHQDGPATVQHALAEVGMFAGADRCGYFVIDPKTATMSCRYKWLRPEIPETNLGLQDLPIADYGWALPRLLRGEAVSIPRTGALPATATGERRKLEANAVRSLLLVPILSGGQITSFMSLTAVRTEMEWGSDVALLMRIAGEMILNALQRNETDRTQQAHIRALEDVNLELERRNTDLQKLAYVASHDLQEPLRVVSSFSSLLGQHYQGQLDARADEYIAYITDAAGRLHRLINDLLAYTRVDYQVKELVACDLNEIARIVQDNLAPTAQSMAARIEATDLPTVRADPLQMIQLLQHLLANALRFHAQEPPQIHIAAERGTDEWVISVADNGIGIAPEHTQRVFEIFQRLHTRDSYPGSGIGLAVCRRIVERHGGRIWVEPNPPHGSVFRFTLPDRSTGHPSLHQAA